MSMIIHWHRSDNNYPHFIDEVTKTEKTDVSPRNGVRCWQFCPRVPSALTPGPTPSSEAVTVPRRSEPSAHSQLICRNWDRDGSWLTTPNCIAGRWQSQNLESYWPAACALPELGPGSLFKISNFQRWSFFSFPGEYVDFHQTLDTS